MGNILTKSKKNIYGVLIVMLISAIALSLSKLPFFTHLAISPLIIGIIIGMIYANTIKVNQSLQSGVTFSSKTLLRIAIVFYGFRLTLSQIAEVGISGVAMSVLIVALTFILGYIVGTKILKMDKDLVCLTSAGSAICGAAAVLATEPVVNAKAYKSAIAVSTVVLFGTISMFLYPIVYKLGILNLSADAFGIYLGGTLHEVAHVVGAGGAISKEVADTAIIVKMTRVMCLAPFLLILAWFLNKNQEDKNMPKVGFPFFALMFIVVVIFNSFESFSQQILEHIKTVDDFALTMAMTALGMESKKEKFIQAGLKPFLLALLLFLWLIFGGLSLVYLVA